MSKILLINGSPHEHGCTYTALKEIADTLAAGGVDSEFVYLGTKPVAGCIACGSCAGTGRCAFGDQVNEVLEKLDEYDGIVTGSPVYYAGPSGQICAFLDRLFYASGGRMAGKLAAAVVSCRRGGASAAFDRLNKYFTISNMNVVSSQYWNLSLIHIYAAVHFSGIGLAGYRVASAVSHLLRDFLIQLFYLFPIPVE